MVSVTPASMVWLFTDEGFKIYSATAVLSLKSNDLSSLPTYGTQILFRDFAMCWFGDSGLKATDPASLEALRRLTDTEGALLFKGKDKEADTRVVQLKG